MGLLRTRPDTWARVTQDEPQSIALRVAKTLSDEYPGITALAHEQDGSIRWGVWAKAASAATGQEVRPDPPPSAFRPLETTRLREHRYGSPTEEPSKAPVKVPTASDLRRREVARRPIPEPLRPFVAQKRHGNRPTPGRTDLAYAYLAREYVRLMEAGDTSPAASLGALFGIVHSRVSVHVREARARGFLTLAPHYRRPGGHLTLKALDLIREAEAKAIPAPPAAPQSKPAPVVATIPTPSQIAEITRIKREGAEHEARLREDKSGGGQRATLPATCQPIASPRDLPPVYRPTAERALEQGWAIGRQGNGHYRWISPDGRTITTAATGYTKGRQPHNILSTLRRMGAPVPDAHTQRQAM